MAHGETRQDQPETLSDRDFLIMFADKTDRILALHGQQLDHIDTMLHELHQFVEEHRPALARAMGLMDLGKGWRSWRNGGKADAVP